MKKIAAFLMCLIGSAALYAQSCTPGGGVQCTPNLNLWVLPQHYPNWNVPWNDNVNIIDTLPTLFVNLSPTASQTVTQPVATYTNFNSLLVFGTTPNLQFGTIAGNPSAYFTLTSSGQFSLDTNTVGNHGGSLTLAQLNAVTGIKINGNGGTSGQCLTSDGTAFDLPATCLTSASLYYQTVSIGGTAQIQRPTLNFNALFTATDTATPAQTTIGLNTTGSESKIVTAAAAGTSGYYACWDASGGIGANAGSCGSSTTADVYFSITGCNAGSPYNAAAACSGSGLLPLTAPDTNYIVFCNADYISASGTSYIGISVSTVPTSPTSFTYTQGFIYGNGSSASDQPTPTLQCHYHHS